MRLTEKETKILKTVEKTMSKANERQQDMFLSFIEGMAFLMEEKEKKLVGKQSAQRGGVGSEREAIKNNRGNC